jgi:aminopeptidase YwaD
MKRKHIIVSYILFISLTITACKLSFTSNAANINCIDYSKVISTDAICNTIRKLSAIDNARISGFEGEKDSAEYIAKQFRDMGFDVEEQSFPIKAYRCTYTELNINTPENKKMTSRAFNFSKATPKEGITAEVVFGGMGSNSELENAKVKDKIVLLKNGPGHFRIISERAYEKGAIGIIFYNQIQDQLISASLMELSSIPVVSTLQSQADYIMDMLSSGKTIKVTLKIDSEYKESTSKNIIATLKSKGESNGKNIVVGAHYDGVDTPAANDNASGVATVIEAAKIISTQKLDCNIKFIAFGAEELGLIGSKYYVNSLTPKEKSLIAAMINLDMVGVGDKLMVHTMNDYVQSSIADLAVSCIKKLGYKGGKSQQGGSDHIPFEAEGISAAYLEYETDENNHTDKDTLDRIQKDNLLRACNVLINICMEIGKNSEKLLSK